MRKLTLLIVTCLACVLPVGAVSAATPTFGSSGSGNGGVLDNHTLVLFTFGFNDDELQLDLAAWYPVDEEPETLPPPTCSYSGDTAEDGGLSWSDSGRLVIRLDDVTTTCGTTTAVVEVNYSDSDLETTAIVDDACDGGLRRGVQRISDNTAVASVYIENAAGDPILDATGDGGSAGYQSERYICVDPGS